MMQVAYGRRQHDDVPGRKPALQNQLPHSKALWPGSFSGPPSVFSRNVRAPFNLVHATAARSQSGLASECVRRGSMRWRSPAWTWTRFGSQGCLGHPFDPANGFRAEGRLWTLFASTAFFVRHNSLGALAYSDFHLSYRGFAAQDRVSCGEQRQSPSCIRTDSFFRILRLVS
jgi:hypothetical protein